MDGRITRRSLKDEARLWRAEGPGRSQGAALEHVARAHGFRDWNSAAAALPEGSLGPIGPGARVRGAYLGRPFAGEVLRVEPGRAGRTRVTLRFDEPVEVTDSPHFRHLRSRVTAEVDEDGLSLGRRSDGTPHLRLETG